MKYSVLFLLLAGCATAPTATVVCRQPVTEPIATQCVRDGEYILCRCVVPRQPRKPLFPELDA